jgi:hypothetical protein
MERFSTVLSSTIRHELTNSQVMLQHVVVVATI